MSKIMKMAKGYGFGAVLELKADDGGLSFRGPAVREACERFFRAASQLKKGQYIGFQISVNEGQCGSFRVFSSARAAVKDVDINWIFDGCAAVHGKAEDFAADLFEGERHVYFLERTRGKRKEVGSGDKEEYECRNFSLMLKEAGGVIRVIAKGGCSEKGMIFISLPEKMSLKMRTALTLGFPLTKVSVLKEGIEPARKIRELRIPCLTEGVESLVCLFALKREKEDTDDGCDIYELDEFEEFDEFDEFGPAEAERLEDMGLSVRTYNCLKRAGVNLVDTLRGMSDEELLEIRNFSKKCLEEVRMKLGQPVEKQEKAKEAAAPGPMEMLDELIGLEAVKTQVRKIAAFARMQQDMRARDMQVVTPVFNMEFVGNPGTAKTTVARILAGIFSEIGLLESGELVEAGRADLVGRYVGHTAEKVRDVFEKARGKLLFIDEAYALTDNDRNSFGDEAISTIVQEMENRRDETIVIFAGYPKEMKEFFSVNPGLKSRVPNQIRFDDYSAEELVRIAELESSKRGFAILPEAREKLYAICSEAAGRSELGNGRFCRNLVEDAIMNYAGRAYGSSDEPADLSFALAAEDFHFPEKLKDERRVTMGFRL